MKSLIRRFQAVSIGIVVGCLLLVLGCRGSGSTDTVMVVPVASHPDPLDGTRWKVVAMEDRNNTVNIPADSQLVIEFDKGTLRVVTGCNNPGGHYVLEDSKISITFFRATTMDCTDSIGTDIMAIESVFNSAIPTFESFVIDGDELHIFYADGELQFRRVSD